MGKPLKPRVWHKKAKRYIKITCIDFVFETVSTYRTDRVDGKITISFADVIFEWPTGIGDLYEGDIIRNNWHNVDGGFVGDTWVVCFGEHETSDDYYNDDAYGWYVKSLTKEGVTNSLHNLPCDVMEKGNKVGFGNDSSDIERLGNVRETPELL